MEKEKKEKKMTLVEYYSSLPSMSAPKAELRRTLALACGVSTETVRMWFTGRTPLNKEHCDIIAEITEIPAEVLFPLYRERYGKN